MQRNSFVLRYLKIIETYNMLISVIEVRVQNCYAIHTVKNNCFINFIEPLIKVTTASPPIPSTDHHFPVTLLHSLIPTNH